MTNDNQNFIQGCFSNLIKRKVISESDIKQSTVTDKDIEELQDKIGMEIPTIYKDFLKTYYFEFDELDGVIMHRGAYQEHSIMLFSNKDDNFNELCDRWKFYEEDLKMLSNGYLPIGDWGYGWGPLCIDTSKSLDKVKLDDEKTWSIVWFDHEYFFGGETAEDFIKAALPAAPDFKELLSWFFLNELEE